MSDDIQARLKRLRKAGRKRRPSASPPAPAHDAPADAQTLEALPGIAEVDGAYGRYLLRTVRYPLEHRQGRSSLGQLLTLPPQATQALGSDPAIDFRRAVFLDTETSGLAGGAGTIVFLTGVGVFEDDAYVVRQYFARNPAEESAYLPDLARFIAEHSGLITFNGRSFDWPLLNTRFMLTGVPAPQAEPHLDLLYPARRLWRPRLGACHFGNLEHHILAYRRSGQDIPSWMIPSLWFKFARGQGSSQEMAAILYHNLEDVVSMAPLAYHLAATLAGLIDPHPQDWLALGRAWQRANQLEQAEAAYRRALDTPASRAQAMQELAQLLKRDGRWEEAASWWEALAALHLPGDVDALIELAKYHEWQTRAIEKARAWTLEAITRAESWPQNPHRQAVLAALAHRLQRLERKWVHQDQH